MFIAELGLPDFASYDLTSLRTGIMAGSPCPVEVMKRCVADMHMAEVAICYGMTETSPVSTQTRRDDDLDRRTSTVGRVLPHVEVKVVDPATGMVVPRGETGELCTRGYSVMLGYWDEPAKTAEAIDAARWMHTGDLAVMREDGYVNIVGRIKDMVIRGGENVYPREVEEFLYTHPDIADVQVIGVPDEKYGEELCAWIRLRDGAEPLDADDGARVRHREARALQDPAVRAAGGRVPDDRHRQGPQGRDARALGRPARPGTEAPTDTVRPRPRSLSRPVGPAANAPVAPIRPNAPISVWDNPSSVSGRTTELHKVLKAANTKNASTACARNTGSSVQRLTVERSSS